MGPAFTCGISKHDHRLIAAVALDGTIGKDGQLPWAIAEDMRFSSTRPPGTS